MGFFEAALVEVEVCHLLGELAIGFNEAGSILVCSQARLGGGVQAGLTQIDVYFLVELPICDFLKV
jgi:hypothetical protein